MRLLKILVVLIVLAVLGLTGYAYLGDMAPRQQEIRQPVSLNTGGAPQTNTSAVTPAPDDASGDDSGAQAGGDDEAAANGAETQDANGQ